MGEAWTTGETKKSGGDEELNTKQMIFSGCGSRNGSRCRWQAEQRWHQTDTELETRKDDAQDVH